MEPAQFGMSSSPLVYNDVVVVQTVSEDGSIAGFSAESGVRKWVAGSPECGHASPALLSLCGVRQIVAVTGASVAGIVPQSGELLWEHPFVTDFNCNTANPVQVDESSVLISAGENHGSVLLGVTESDDGWTAEERWSSLGKRSVSRARRETVVMSFSLFHTATKATMLTIGSVRIKLRVAVSDRRVPKRLPRRDRQ